ncbi:MAG: hypothetical protein K6T28_08560 [Acidothermus sp.]|nr:hypothetical protein [Acidothermus sp.]
MSSPVITTTPHPLLAALGKGLPITLLVDLVDPSGPRSREMYEREGLRLDGEWRRVSVSVAAIA